MEFEVTTVLICCLVAVTTAEGSKMASENHAEYWLQSAKNSLEYLNPLNWIPNFLMLAPSQPVEIPLDQQEPIHKGYFNSVQKLSTNSPPILFGSSVVKNARRSNQESQTLGKFPKTVGEDIKFRKILWRTPTREYDAEKYFRQNNLLHSEMNGLSNDGNFDQYQWEDPDKRENRGFPTAFSRDEYLGNFQPYQMRSPYQSHQRQVFPEFFLQGEGRWRAKGRSLPWGLEIENPHKHKDGGIPVSEELNSGRNRQPFQRAIVNEKLTKKNKDPEDSPDLLHVSEELNSGRNSKLNKNRDPEDGFPELPHVNKELNSGRKRKTTKNQDPEELPHVNFAKGSQTIPVYTLKQFVNTRQTSNARQEYNH